MVTQTNAAPALTPELLKAEIKSRTKDYLLTKAECLWRPGMDANQEAAAMQGLISLLLCIDNETKRCAYVRSIANSIKQQYDDHCEEIFKLKKTLDAKDKNATKLQDKKGEVNKIELASLIEECKKLKTQLADLRVNEIIRLTEGQIKKEVEKEMSRRKELADASKLKSNSINPIKPSENGIPDNDTYKNETDAPPIVRAEKFLKAHYEFKRNTVTGQITYKEKGQNEGGWKEANENEISRTLEHNYHKFPPGRTLALLNSEFVPDFDPFMNYFKSLSYDPAKEPSYIDLLLSNIKATEQELFNSHFRKMLIRCVACSLPTGPINNNFNKQVFVLVNRRQSIGKTSFIRFLCPPALQDYYVENPTIDKDGKISLATCFMLNMDELSKLPKLDLNQMKAWISTAFINERLPYAKRRTSYPRRANFFATTNEAEFLSDDTGNARWLIFEIEDFEKGYWLEGNQKFVDINKVWAEAYYLYKNGVEYQLTAAEKTENDTRNTSFEERSIEEEMIALYFKRDDKEEKANFKTTTEVLRILNELFPSNKITLKKVGSILRKLNFKIGQERINGVPVKGYYAITEMKKSGLDPEDNKSIESQKSDTECLSDVF